MSSFNEVARQVIGLKWFNYSNKISNTVKYLFCSLKKINFKFQTKEIMSIGIKVTLIFLCLFKSIPTARTSLIKLLSWYQSSLKTL